MAYDPTTTVTDDVTDNLAQYHNELVTAATHVMSAVPYSGYVYAASMTGDVTLTDADFPVQSFSPTAARNLTLPAVASTNHGFYVINRSGTYAITVKNASSSTVYSLTAGTSVFLISDGANNWYAIGGGSSNTYGNLFGADSVMLNGKISVTVASNNLTVAIKTLAGTDPSSSDPVYVRIGSTVRSITGALSVTKNAGTNWCNSGGTELATKEVDYFVYLIWNTTPATDVIDIGFSRIPYGTVYSDFSGTSTNEKYLANGNASAPTSTDDVVNIGRFAATLSAGAGYTWTVPTFTTSNLIQRPIYETRLLSWSPSWTNLTVGNGTQVATYKMINTILDFNVDFIFGSTSSISGDVSHSTPIAGVGYGNAKVAGTVAFKDTGTAQYSGVNLMQSASLINYRALNAAGTYASQVALSSTIPHTWAATDELHEWTNYNMV